MPGSSRDNRSPRLARAALDPDAMRWMTNAASEAATAVNRNTTKPLYELRDWSIGTIVSHP